MSVRRYGNLRNFEAHMRKFFLFIGIVLLTIDSHSGVIYVNAAASGSNNGTSWANAYTDLQSALSIAFINDEIWVAAGTYKPTSTTDRSISFVMKNGVDMFGGFAGTETSIAERNIADNPTYLSGDIGQPGDNTDNSLKVVRIQNFTTPFVFDGFRVVSGYDGSSSGKGAGMYVFNNPASSITINNTILFNNYAYHSGGGMIIDNSTTLFNHCEFLYNSSFNYGGGAIYSANVSNASIYLYDCIFTGNTSREGPVINFDGDELIMERNVISSNSSTTSGNIINVSLGVTRFEINNSLIVGNLVDNAGSSIISSYTSGPNSSSLTNVTICHNRNSSNLDVYAEAIYQSNSAMVISNCIIFGNTPSDVNAQIDGGNTVRNSIVQNGYTGGIALSGSDPMFINPANASMAPFDASAFDYSLLEGSPAINFGNNLYAEDFTLDLRNNSRIQQLVVDCGAIESSYADLQAPVAQCNSVTLPLDASGEAVLSSALVNNNSTDNVGVAGLVLSQTNFDCTHIGPNEVQLVVSDLAGNTSTCNASVVVADASIPTLLTEDISVILDENGEASISIEDVDAGTTDNCGLDTLFLSQYDFSCADVGANTIVFTAQDLQGNAASVNVSVTVVDAVFPQIQAQNISVYLNADGEASVLPSAADNGSTDDCSIASLSLGQLDFSCQDLGANPTMFTVGDSFGNTVSTGVTVFVQDTIAPVTQGQSISVNLFTANPALISATHINTNSFDNCSFTQTVSPSSFSTVGVYDVVLTSTDPSGNSSSATYTVTVINEPTVGVDELTEAPFSVYPNPSSGWLYITSVTPESTIEIRLYDITGKLLTTEQFYYTPQLQYLLPESVGVYFIEMITPTQRSHRVRVVRM